MVTIFDQSGCWLPELAQAVDIRTKGDILSASASFGRRAHPTRRNKKEEASTKDSNQRKRRRRGPKIKEKRGKEIGRGWLCEVIWTRGETVEASGSEVGLESPLPQFNAKVGAANSGAKGLKAAGAGI